MSYTAGLFYVDFESGSDAARTALTGCVISNPSGSVISVNKTAHGLVAGAIFDATLFQAWFNAAWKVLSVTDADNFVVEGTWQASADANGTITPRGGSSKADAWKTSPSAARHQAGDTVRYKASADATSLGVNGTWTDGPLAATQNITSSTNATPIVVTKASHGYSNGDTLIVDGHATNTAANGTWTAANVTANTYELQGSVGNGVGGITGTSRKINNCVVTLASAVGGDSVACPRDGETGNRGTKTNWTASANVTCSVSTGDFKQGSECQSIAIGSAFTTGLAAYLALASAKDYSSRQQLTFWIKQLSGVIGAAGAIRLRLCSDTAGATPVDSFDVPAIGAINQWMAVTVDKGSALGSSIQSINFDVVTDNGAQTFLIDCVRTVNSVASADSLSLTSLIGKSGGVDSSWLAIASIVGTRVMLDQGVNTIPAASPPRGYTGTTETVTTYKRQPFLDTVGTTTTSGPASVIWNLAGSIASRITHSFGWDRTSMSTRDSESWYSGQNGLGIGMGRNGSVSGLIIEGVVGLSRYYEAVYHTLGGLNRYDAIHANNNGNRCLFNNQAYRSTYGFESARNNGGGLTFVADDFAFTKMRYFGNGGTISMQGGGGSYADMVIKNNNAYGLTIGSALVGGGPNTMTGLVTADNTGGIFMQGDTILYSKGAVIGEATEVGSGGSQIDWRVVSEDHDGSAGNTQVFAEGGRIASETTIRHTASGKAWSMAVTSTATRDATLPLTQRVAVVAVAANALVTVKLWMYRTDTGLTFSLMCKGGQIAGVTADAYTAMTAAATTWEEVTLTFTPTEAGVVEITAEAYGGTTYIGYFDDFSVSQA